MSIGKFFGHLNMIIKHKHYVFIHCCKCGLVWQGLVHDLSKFSFTEFREGIKYYSGKGSPNAISRKTNGYSLSWIHHKGRNKHHCEYWFDICNEKQMDMPYKYAVECVCDRIAACKCYKGKEYTDGYALEYFYMVKDKEQASDNIKLFLERVFIDLRDNGEKYILNKKYMKKTYKELVNFKVEYK